MYIEAISSESKVFSKPSESMRFWPSVASEELPAEADGMLLLVCFRHSPATNKETGWLAAL